MTTLRARKNGSLTNPSIYFTIPKQIADKLDLDVNDELELEVKDSNSIILKRPDIYNMSERYKRYGEAKEYTEFTFPDEILRDEEITEYVFGEENLPYAVGTICAMKSITVLIVGVLPGTQFAVVPVVETDECAEHIALDIPFPLKRGKKWCALLEHFHIVKNIFVLSPLCTVDREVEKKMRRIVSGFFTNWMYEDLD